MSLIRSHLPQRQGQEVQDVYDKIYEHEKAITDLDDQIATLMADVRHLRSKRMQHEERVLAYKSLVSLARRLPHELLACIFEYCVSTGWPHAPVVLSHVCTDWRIAAMTPSVWSRVHVFSTIEGDYSRAVERIKVWLQRAGSIPLYITLHVSGMTASLQESMRRLSNCSAQWRTIDIIARNVSQVNQVLTLIDRSPPRLEMVAIRLPDELFTDVLAGETPMNLSSLQSFPSLSTVCIYRDLYTYQGVPSQITSLSLGSPDTALTDTLWLEKLLEVLAQTPKLVTFSLKAAAGRLSWEVPNDAMNVELNELKKATLTGDDSLIVLLSRIRAPSLSHLRIRSTLSFDRSGQFAAFLLAFLARCNPQLEYLELHDVDSGDEGLAPCLPYLCNLRALRLHESEVSSTTIGTLADFCPRLTRLDLRWCGSVTGAALVGLVQRYQGTMREVAAINCAHVKEEDIIQLAKLTVCRVVMEGRHDYCQELRCCHNELYRRRLLLRGLLPMIGQSSRYLPYGQRTGVII